MDTDLHILEAEIAGLPDLATSWDKQSENAHLDWQWEWWDLMSRFGLVQQAHQDGRLTDQQSRRFERIAAQLEAVLPIIDCLGLPRPPVLSKR